MITLKNYYSSSWFSFKKTIPIESLDLICGKYEQELLLWNDPTDEVVAV